jgi:hypothetical protein
MRSKQLANVLIKILGLAVCVRGVPTFLSELLSLLRLAADDASTGSYWLVPVPSLILVIIGIYLIVRSRNVPEYLFKGEDG